VDPLHHWWSHYIIGGPITSLVVPLHHWWSHYIITSRIITLRIFTPRVKMVMVSLHQYTITIFTFSLCQVFLPYVYTYFFVWQKTKFLIFPRESSSQSSHRQILLTSCPSSHPLSARLSFYIYIHIYIYIYIHTFARAIFSFFARILIARLSPPKSPYVITFSTSS